MGKYTEWAISLRRQMETAAAVVDDATGSKCASIFPIMKYDGSLIQSGTRINWGGTLKRAAVDLWDREDSNPDNAPTLWEDVAYYNGYRIIPETITATLAFSADEIGYDPVTEKYYRCKYDGTTWPPSVVPSSWDEITI